MAKEFFTKDQVVLADLPARKDFLDITGKIIGNLSVVGLYGWDEKCNQFWWCKCSCTEGRYFKVNASSLKRGITKSCGCRYKNNGGSSDTSTCKSEASFLLNSHLDFKEFSGWNYPCRIYCSECKKETTFSKANNARGFMCCESPVEEAISSYLDKFDYQLVGEGKAKCNLCGLVQKRSAIKGCCGCKDLPEGSTPCAVYILQEENNPWVKIGKGLLPECRRYSINRSANLVGYSFPVVSKQIWVNGEKAAYRLERMLHQYFEREKVRLPKFDGYDEVFAASLEDCDRYLKIISSVLDRFILKGYQPRFELPEHTLEQSIEWCGNWYRSKTHLLKVENYSSSEFTLVENFTCKTKATHRVAWRRSASRWDSELLSEKLHGKDWGDGLFGTINGLSRRYGHEDGNVWHRVNKVGYSMKEALALPQDNLEGYWRLNNKYYRKQVLCNLLDMSPHTVVQRVNRGIPLKYALIPFRWRQSQTLDRIYLLDGEAFWFGDVCEIFGIKESFGKLYHTQYTGIIHYLEEYGLLPEGWSIEEIKFENYKPKHK